eukprot:jgi/Mesvir1/11186/Mv14577-RA.1
MLCGGVISLYLVACVILCSAGIPVFAKLGWKTDHADLILLASSQQRDELACLVVGVARSTVESDMDPMTVEGLMVTDDGTPVPSPAVAASDLLPAAAVDPLLMAPLTLQDLAATPGLGAMIIGDLPLPDRVRLRGLCHAFKSSVDASLQDVRDILAKELFALDRCGRAHGAALRWLATKCPNLQALEAQGPPGTWPMRRWWNLPVADDVIIHLATQCRQLRTLNLRRCRGVKDTALRAVAANCGQLRHLDVGYCSLVTDAGVSAIAAGCQQLEVLDVRYVQGVTDVSIAAVAAHCPRLCGLDVGGTGVGSAGLVELALGCHELRSLDVTFCEAVDDLGVFAVARMCPLLESLDYTLTPVSDYGIGAVISHCAQLRRLCLGEQATDEAVRLRPESCRQMRSLRVTSPYLTDAALAPLAASCPHLASLSLSQCPMVTDLSLMAFAASCPALEELSIRSCEVVSDAGVLVVARKCRRLAAVSVVDCASVSDTSVVELVRNCRGLRTLALSGCFAGNRTAHALARYAHDLCSLDLSMLYSPGEGGSDRWVAEQNPASRRLWEEEARLRDDGLASVLQNCLKLESLSLGGCRGLSDAGIRMAGDACKNLRDLNLNYCRGCFTPDGLASMAGHLGALEELGVAECDAANDASITAVASQCPRLRIVDASRCDGVTDEGVDALATRCSLVKLRVSGCSGVTDASMIIVGERCPALEELDVSQCSGVTVTGVLAVLCECKGLRELGITGCSLTANDLQLVRYQRQRLDLLSEGNGGVKMTMDKFKDPAAPLAHFAHIAFFSIMAMQLACPPSTMQKHQLYQGHSQRMQGEMCLPSRIWARTMSYGSTSNIPAGNDLLLQYLLFMLAQKYTARPLAANTLRNSQQGLVDSAPRFQVFPFLPLAIMNEGDSANRDNEQWRGVGMQNLSKKWFRRCLRSPGKLRINYQSRNFTVVRPNLLVRCLSLSLRRQLKVSPDEYVALSDGTCVVKPYFFVFVANVKRRWEGQTLVDAFSKEFPQRDRAYYIKATECGRLQVNGHNVRPDHILHTGDWIGHHIHRHEPRVLSQKIQVLHVSNDFVVVNKPASLPVHQCGQYRKNTVLAVLQAQNEEFKTLLPLHRLDRPVSGVLIFGRNPTAAKRFSQQIEQKGVVKKEYLALVMGVFPEGEVVVDKGIMFHSNLGRSVIYEGDKGDKSQDVDTATRDNCDNNNNNSNSNSNNNDNSNDAGACVAAPSTDAAARDEKGADGDQAAPPVPDARDNNDDIHNDHDPAEGKGGNKMSSVGGAVEGSRRGRGPPPNRPLPEELDERVPCADAKGKDAYTLFERVRSNGTYSLVRCRPQTGRTHQLRVHLQYLGHPIVNDPLYNHAALSQGLDASLLLVPPPQPQGDVAAGSPGAVTEAGSTHASRDAHASREENTSVAREATACKPELASLAAAATPAEVAPSRDVGAEPASVKEGVCGTTVKDGEAGKHGGGNASAPGKAPGTTVHHWGPDGRLRLLPEEVDEMCPHCPDYAPEWARLGIHGAATSVGSCYLESVQLLHLI